MKGTGMKMADLKMTNIMADIRADMKPAGIRKAGMDGRRAKSAMAAVLMLLLMMSMFIFPFAAFAVASEGETEDGIVEQFFLFSDNPANEAFAETRFELDLVDLSLVFKNNLFNLNNLNADLQDPEVKEEFLSRLGDGGFNANLGGDLKAGMRIGRVGLHVRPVVVGTAYTAEDVPELIFNGLDVNETYDLSGTRVDIMAALSFDVSHAFPVRLNDGSSLGFGITAHVMKGLAIIHAEIGELEITTDEIGNTSYHIKDAVFVAGPDENIAGDGEETLPGEEYSEIGEAEGTGLLFDLGAVYRKGRFQAGVALKNIGAISWNGIHGGRYTEEEGDIMTAGPNGPEFPDWEELGLEPEVFHSYTMKIPMIVEFEAAYQILPSLVWNAGISKGFDNGWGVSKVPRLSTGFVWSPVRILAVGGDVGLQGGYIDFEGLCELRLNPLNIGLRFGWSDNRINRFSDDSTGASASLTLGFRF